MMGELCLGALKLQGMQSFWAADGMCSSGAEDGLLRKTRTAAGNAQNSTPISSLAPKLPKSQQMESLGCSSGSMRLSCGAPASPMHLAFCPARYRNSVAAALSATHATRQTLPQTARFDRGSVLGRRHQAAAAGSTPGRRHQAAAAGSTPRRRRWNTTANAAWVAVIKAAGRKVGSLDQLRRPPAMPLSPPLSPSSSLEVKKESMWLKGAQREVENGLGL
ncbi:hypothetical protein CK203_104059 [Vitis vinifera]|uniref:Uncharacterized protein n=1 Tax=Vitis vinifera TaxID=29760 RepID=A0A438F1J5_VITVI|nr:hypothetical protein CK203_104059 [Vitis vinifera]